MTAPVDVPLPRLGPYRIERKLAEGGMASVFVAHRELGSVDSVEGEPWTGPDRVALKMIREEFVRSREFLDMFVDEAKIVARLRHPNIVRTFEQGSIDGHAFIAMELLSGQSLWQVWDACRTRRVRLRYDMIAWIGARVADGLEYAHRLRDEQGSPLRIVHRDINPSNIFVTTEGTIKVIDFGLAKAANRASRTATGVVKGKVAYMSPEQAAGEPIDHRSDLFALATTLWELACDQRLFKGADDLQTLRRVRAAKVPDPTTLVAGFPPALWGVLWRAFTRDPRERTASAAELSRDLDAFAGGVVSNATLVEMMRELFPASSTALMPEPAIRPLPSVGVTSRTKWTVMAALLVVLLAGVSIALAFALK